MARKPTKKIRVGGKTRYMVNGKFATRAAYMAATRTRRNPAKKAVKKATKKRRSPLAKASRSSKARAKSGKRPVDVAMRSPGPGRRKVQYKTYRTTRKRGKTKFFTYHVVRSNSPITALTKAAKQGAVVAGFLYLARVLSGAIDEYLVGYPGDGTATGKGKGLLAGEKKGDTGSTMLTVAPYLPGLGTFVLSTLLAPKVFKNKEYAGVAQLSGFLVLIDTVMNRKVLPMLKASAKDKTTGTVDTKSFAYKAAQWLGTGSSGLHGLGDMSGVGLGATYPEFVDETPTAAAPIGGMDAYVDEIEQDLGDMGEDPTQAPEPPAYGYSLYDDDSMN